MYRQGLAAYRATLTRPRDRTTRTCTELDSTRSAMLYSDTARPTCAPAPPGGIPGALPMMTIARVALLLAVPTFLLAGCQTTPKPAPEPVVTISPAEALAKVRAEFASTPDAKFASVGEVLEGEGWIALADATAADFPDGSLLSVVDENANVIGFATVRKPEGGNVYCEFYKGSGRSVRVGDVAVKFPESK